MGRGEGREERRGQRERGGEGGEVKRRDREEGDGRKGKGGEDTWKCKEGE